MSLHWYPFMWGQYATKTSHLSQGEHGAFLLFMAYIYTRDAQGVPDKQRYSIARAVLEQERANADAVLDEFFDLKDGFWVNDTCAEIISKQNKRHQKRVIAGKLGGKQKSSNARVMLPQKPSNTPQKENQNQKDISNDISNTEAEMFFLSVWDAYPGHGKHGARGSGFKGPRKKAFEIFTKLLKAEKDHDGFTKNLIAGAYVYKQFLDESGSPSKHLTTWLNQECWRDDYSTDGGTGGDNIHARALAEGVRGIMQFDGGEEQDEHGDVSPLPSDE